MVSLCDMKRMDNQEMEMISEQTYTKQHEGHFRLFNIEKHETKDKLAKQDIFSLISVNSVIHSKYF